MTKLIVEMEMPRACPCDLIGVGYAMCCSGVIGLPKRIVEYDECVKNGTRPDWCPIKGVLPDTHGDLIDRDKLLNDIEMYHVSEGWFQHWVELQDAVVAAEGKDDE